MADAGGDADGRPSDGRDLGLGHHFIEDKRARRRVTLGAALVIGVILLVLIASALR
jgi:hypothetical protein